MNSRVEEKIIDIAEDEQELEVPGAPVNSDDIRTSEPRIYELLRDHSPHLQVRNLFKSDLFLALLVLTVLNAVIYYHFAVTDPEALEIKAANSQARAELNDENDFFGIITDFVSGHGRYPNASGAEFGVALNHFKAKLQRFGIDSDDSFDKDEYLPRNQGIYWSKREVRSPTAYQPITK